MSDLVIRGARVVTPDGLRAAAVHISSGVITALTEPGDIPRSATVTDAGNAIVMPGVVDTHVHVNEPGRTDWEGFETATRAAAAGGVTTLLDMPLNSIPATTTVASLDAKRRAASGKCWVNVGFIGGVVPGNAGDLRALHEGGARAFKCFLVPSGVDEFPAVSEADLRAALPVLAGLGATLMVHAELPGLISSAALHDPRRYESFRMSRPSDAEVQAVALLITLAEEFGARVHIVHLSSERSLRPLRDARARGIAISSETCPHYLTFAAEDIEDGATAFKCAPPIRAASTREALWRGLLNGDIDGIVSDHSPCPPSLKCEDTGDFFAAWGGIASLQLGIPVVWDGARSRGIGVERLAGWMCEAPARLAGLAARKGRIAPGYDADLVIWNPDQPVLVNPDALHHRHKITPYSGRVVHGDVLATYVAGHLVYANRQLVGPPRGVLLT